MLFFTSNLFSRDCTEISVTGSVAFFCCCCFLLRAIAVYVTKSNNNNKQTKKRRKRNENICSMITFACVFTKNPS